RKSEDAIDAALRREDVPEAIRRRLPRRQGHDRSAGARRREGYARAEPSAIEQHQGGAAARAERPRVAAPPRRPVGPVRHRRAERRAKARVLDPAAKAAGRERTPELRALELAARGLGELRPR